MSYLDEIKAKTALSGTDSADSVEGAATNVSTVSSPSAHSGEKNEPPLSAKLRTLGVPLALEVAGEFVAWLVSDADAVARTDLNPRFTAAEAEVLAQFDAKGMRDLIDLKRHLGGRLQSEENIR